MATKKARPTKAKKSAKTKVVRTATVANASAGGNGVANMIAKAPLGAMLAEFFGAFLLAAIVVSTSNQPIFVMFGLVAIVLTIWHLSGAHVNPAITFGAWITRKINSLNAVGYIVAQVLGAMLALVVLTALVGGAPGQADPLTGQPQAAELFKAVQTVEGKEWYAVFASMLGLGIFSFAFASALREKKEHIASAFTIGAGFFIALIVAGQAAILNPATALTLQAFTDLKGDNALSWGLAIHVVAPLIGATIGFLLYDLLRRDVDTSR